jgi:hypothetical protein
MGGLGTPPPQSVVGSFDRDRSVGGISRGGRWGGGECEPLLEKSNGPVS